MVYRLPSVVVSLASIDAPCARAVTTASSSAATRKKYGHCGCTPGESSRPPSFRPRPARQGRGRAPAPSGSPNDQPKTVLPARLRAPPGTCAARGRRQPPSKVRPVPNAINQRAARIAKHEPATGPRARALGSESPRSAVSMTPSQCGRAPRANACSRSGPQVSPWCPSTASSRRVLRHRGRTEGSRLQVKRLLGRRAGRGRSRSLECRSS
jgi:hypothetical protein